MKLLKKPNLVINLKALISKENKKEKHFIIIKDLNYSNKTNFKEIYTIYKSEYLNETL